MQISSEATHSMHTCRSGVAMILVLVAITVAMVMGLSFQAAQSTTIGVGENIRRHDRARYIAETALTAALKQVKADTDWRTKMANWTPTPPQSFAGGTYTVLLEDCRWSNGLIDGDGDILDEPEHPVVFTVTGTFDGVTHVSRAMVVPAIDAVSGLRAHWYDLGVEPTKLDDIPLKEVPTFNSRVPNIDFQQQETALGSRWPGSPSQYFGARFYGSIYIPTAGTWTFYTNSDDGSLLRIGDNYLVINDGQHAMKVVSASINLTEGWQYFETRWFEWRIHNGFIASWKGPGEASASVIPESAFKPPVEPRNSLAGLVVNNQITISGYGTDPSYYLLAYDSSIREYDNRNRYLDKAVIATNSTGSQRIALSGKAKIWGNAMVGVGGNPDNVIVNWDNSTITGKKTTMVNAIPIPVVEEPAGLPASEGDQTYSANVTFNSNRRFNSLSFIGNSTTWTINGDINVLVDGNVSLANKVKVVINAGSTLKLYVKGNMEVRNQVEANIGTNKYKAKQFQIYILGANRHFTIRDTAQVSAAVSNPGGTMYQWGAPTGGSWFYGTYMGDSYQSGDNCRFIMDVADPNNGVATPQTVKGYTVVWLEQP